MYFIKPAIERTIQMILIYYLCHCQKLCSIWIGAKEETIDVLDNYISCKNINKESPKGKKKKKKKKKKKNKNFF